MRFQPLSLLLLAPFALAQAPSSYPTTPESTTTLTSTATLTKTITVSQVVAAVTSTYALFNSSVPFPTAPSSGIGGFVVPTGSIPTKPSAPAVPSPIAVSANGATSLKAISAGSVGLAVAVAAAFL